MTFNVLIHRPPSIKEIQATGEAFSPQKRTSSTLKLKISSPFPIFVGNFCISGSGSIRPKTEVDPCGSESETVVGIYTVFACIMTNDALAILAEERTVWTAEGFLARHRNDGFYSARKVPLHHVVLKRFQR